METKTEQAVPKDVVEDLINPTNGKSTMETKTDQTRKVRNTVGLLLTVVMLGLTVYVLYIQSENYRTMELTSNIALNSNDKQAENYRYYVKQYSTAQAQLDETQARLSKMTMELELVSKELDSTRNMLSQTESLLAQAQQENQVLKGDPQAMANLQKVFGNQANVAAAKNIDTLKKQNDSYGEELAKMRGELDSYQASFADIKAGKSVIAELKEKIRSVKDRMRQLKRDAVIAREAAQKERDRQLYALGNNGYVTKDGEPQMVNKGKKTVDIDVKFVP